MDEHRIVKNIRKLSDYIDNCYLKTEEEKFSMFKSNFTVFNQQLVTYYNYWFPNSKKAKDEIIANIIFAPKQKDIKNWVKYSLICLINSSKRIYDNSLNFKDSSDNRLFICEMELLNEISFEAAIFMESAFKIMENKTIEFGHGKRANIHSFETYNASRQILRKYSSPKTLGDFVLSPTSIFLIRQSIELWLFYIFGINNVIDEQDNLIKLQPEKLFKLIDSKGIKVNLPVSKTVIEKIHAWTQVYVHAGRLPYIWEIEHAQHILNPIFNSSEIKVDETYFNEIPNEIRKILNNDALKIIRQRGSSIKIE